MPPLQNFLRRFKNFRVRRRNQSRLRRMMYEGLEDRNLLTMDSVAWASIQGGLENRVLSWLDSVDNQGQYAKTIPVLGRSLSEIVPLNTVFEQTFVSPFKNFIAANPTSQIPQFVSWINGRANTTAAGYQIVVSSATGEDTGTEARVNLSMRIRKVESSLGLVVLSEQSQVTVGIDPLANVQLHTDVSFDVTFGTQLSSSKLFFLKDENPVEIAITSAINIPGVNKNIPSNQSRAGTGQIGFIDVGLNVSLDNLAQVGVTLIDNWDDPGSANDYWFSTPTEGDDTFDNAIANPAGFSESNMNGVADFRATVTPTRVNGPSRPLQEKTTIDGGITNVVSSSGTFHDLTKYSKILPETFSGGIKQTTELIERVARDSEPGTNPWNRELAFLGKSWVELIGLGDYFKTSLVGPTEFVYNPSNNVATTIPFRTDQDLLDKLDSLSPGPNVSVVYSDQDIRYTVHIDKTISKSIETKIALGRQLDLPLQRLVNYSFDTDIDLQFGVRTSDGEFFIVESTTPQFSVAFGANPSSIPGSSTPTRLGFTELTVSGGTLSTAATAAIRLTDYVDSRIDGAASLPPNIRRIFGDAPRPATPGLITSAEMLGASIVEDNIEKPDPDALNALSHLLASPSGASLSLDVSGTIPGQSLESGRIGIQWADLFQPSQATISNTSGISTLIKFNSIQPSDFVLGGLGQIPTTLQQLTDTAALGKSLPLVGSSFAQASQLHTKFQQWLDQLGNESVKKEMTIQKLRSQLTSLIGSWLDGSIDVLLSNDDVRLRIPLQQIVTNQNLSLSFSERLPLLDLGLQAAGQINVNGVVRARLVPGILFAGTNLDDRFFLAANGDTQDLASSQSSLEFRAATPATGIATSIHLGLSKLAGSIIANIGNANNLAKLVLPYREPTGSAIDQRILLKELKLRGLELFSTIQPNEVTSTARINLPAVGSNPIPDIQIAWNTLLGMPTWTSFNASELSPYVIGSTTYNANSVRDGMDSILGLLNRWLADGALNRKILGIDKSLRQIVPQIEDVRRLVSKILSSDLSSSTKFDSAVSTAVTSLGLNPLVFSLTPSTDSSEHAPNAGRFRYRMRANILPFAPSASLDLSSISPTMQLAGQIGTNSSVSLQVEFDFGYNKADGFFVAARDGNVPEFRIAASLSTGIDKASGQFGPVTIGANGSISGQLEAKLDLVDPNSSGKITWSELSNNLASVLVGNATGSAHLQLTLGGRIGSDGPGFRTGFNADWNLARPTVIAFGPNGSTNPEDGFSAPQLYLGEMLRKILGPVLKEINDHNPIPEEILSFLTTKLPVINVSPLDILAAGTKMPKEVLLVFEIADIAQRLSAMLGSEYSMKLSDLIVGETDGNGTGGDEPSDSVGQFTGLLDKLQKEYALDLPFLRSPSQSVVKLLLNQPLDFVTWKPQKLVLEKKLPGVKFPVAQIGPVTVLLGYDGSFGFTGHFGVGLDSSGLQDLDGDGHRNLMDGFYFDDHKIGSNDGPEITAFAQINLRAEASLAGIIGIYGKGGIRGEIQADATDLRPNPAGSNLPRLLAGRCDSGSDGRIRLEEIGTIVDTYGPTSLANLGGVVSIVVEIGASFLFFDIPIIQEDFPILTFGSASCSSKIEQAHFVDIVGTTAIITSHDDSDGTTLEAKVLRNEAQTPIGVRFIRTQGSDHQIQDFDLHALASVRTLDFQGSDGADRITLDRELTKILDIKWINASGGNGNDYIDLAQDIEGSHLIGTTILGGNGDDRLSGTFAPDTIYGHFGADHLDGRDGENLLYGDRLTDEPSDAAYSGKDSIKGGKDRDVIYGGYGNDKIVAGDGDNLIIGGWGSDAISSGSGADEIWGGNLNDAASPYFGVDLGSDSIVSTSGNDIIHGGSGNDYILTGDGNSSVYGGFGRDTIQVGTGSNFVWGGSGNDEIKSGDGNDHLYGEDGNDFISSSGGENWIYGHNGNDTIQGGSGRDHIFGEDGEDRIFGGEGDNEIYGGYDKDTIEAGSGTNVIYGDLENESSRDGDDTIIATSNAPGSALYVRGGGGSDLIVGQSFHSDIRGGSGLLDEIRLDGTGPESIVYGDFVGDETIHDGRDIILVNNNFGVFQPSTAIKVFGGGGDDEIATNQIANVTIFGGSGSETYIHVFGASVTRVYGDSLFENTNDGNDTIQVEVSVDAFVYGLGGSDTIQTSAGTSFDVRGGSGNDHLTVTGNGLGQNFGRVFGDQDESEYTNDGHDTILMFGPAKVWGSGGSDTITLVDQWNGNSILYGGSNDDQIRLEGGSVNAIYGEGGDDLISSTFGRDTVHGGLGSDIIDVGANADTIDGADGNDQLLGGAGNDVILGGAGHDFIMGGDDIDQIEGGIGNDTVVGDNAFYSVSDLLAGLYSVLLFSGGSSDTISGGDGLDILYGTGGDDVIHGDLDDDLIFGNEGRDEIYGGSGIDRISGGDGVDKLYGDDGNDILYGNKNDDLIVGGKGNDQISGNEGDDDLYGNDGDDTINGNEDADRIWGGSGFDTLHGGLGRDILRGQLGDDTINGDDGEDDLFGDEGIDRISGGTGIDHIFGGSGDDLLAGYSLTTTLEDDETRDYLYGESGSDQLSGGGGDDYLDGGADRDILRGEAGQDHLVAGSGLGDLLQGGLGDDILVGSDDSAIPAPGVPFTGDTIEGDEGNDRIYGLGGFDTLRGGDGDDWIDSGIGTDTVSGGNGDDTLYAGIGLGDTIDGDAGDDVLYGTDQGSDLLRGGTGKDRIYGQNGNDQIEGGDGDDYLDGGAGTDIVIGGLGSDELLGGVGQNDHLEGGAGDDILRGSDDGADTLLGDAGRDRLLGNGGNDWLDGGSDDDILEGGSGDDRLEGGIGKDLLLGGPHHDSLYGQSISGTGDDHAVDYLYGDFGTDNNEPDAGQDQLFGQGGNDILFGEGADDLIDGGAGLSNQIFFGAGEGANPTDFVAPTPTPPPTLQPPTAPFDLAPASLPNSEPDIRGLWFEISGVGGKDGFTRSPTKATQPSMVTNPSGILYTAWVDSRNGNDEIYVARYVPSTAASETLPAGWSELASSSSQGGLSNSPGASRQPSIALDLDGQPIVTWSEFLPDSSGLMSNIRVAKFSPLANNGTGQWLPLANSLSASGISGTHQATHPKIVVTNQGPVVAWMDRSSGTDQVYVAAFRSGVWSGLGGSGSISGQGVSATSGTMTSLDLASDSNRVLLTWTNESGGDHRVFAREFRNSSWQSLGSNADGSIHVSIEAREVTAAYFGSEIYVAWSDQSSSHSEIYVQRFNGADWIEVQSESNFHGGLSNALGRANQPQLRSGGGQLYLAWSVDTLANRVDTVNGLTVARWTGSTFQKDVGLSSHAAKIRTTSEIDSLQLTIDSLGRPFIAWNALGGSVRQNFVLRGSDSTSRRVFEASATGPSVQSILDSQSLGPNDVILISGTVAGFTIGGSDAGVTFTGNANSSILGNVQVNATNVTFDSVSIFGSITSTNIDRLTITRSRVTGSISLNGGSEHQVTYNQIHGPLSISADAAQVLVSRNAIAAGNGTAITVSGLGVNGLVVQDNGITGAIGILLDSSIHGRIERNTIRGSSVGLSIQQPFQGQIQSNEISDGATGVVYAASAPLSMNRIRNNTVGIRSTVSGPGALGFLPNAIPNEIYANQTGVALTGELQNQFIHHNVLGVTGTGILGGNNLDFANRIENNTTGTNLNGPIRFNRFGMNVTAILAQSNQSIDHNILYDSVGTGIHIAGKTLVRIENNTVVSPTGDMIRIDQASSNVEILNNILWSENGFDLFVANDSTTGFFSDYNLLHASNGGKLVYWAGEYSDILDWQENVYEYDLHSRGRTSVNPLWSEPRFLNRAHGDFRVFGTSAQLRSSSPSFDTGNPLVDASQSILGYTNLLTNPSFEAGLTGWTATPSGATRSASPTPFAGSSYLSAASNAVTTVSQTVELLTLGVDTTDKAVIYGGRVRTVEEMPKDQAQLKIEFLDASNQVLASYLQNGTGRSDRWESVGGRATLPDGVRFIRYQLTANRRSGTTNDVFLDGAFIYVISNRIAPDLGAYGNAPSEQNAIHSPRLQLLSPDLYLDAQRDKPLAIRWQSFRNDGDAAVRIDLYQDSPEGPRLLLNISSGTADTGRYDWIPSNHGLDFGTYGLRIQIQLIGSPLARDLGTESFTIPENTNTYFVNDGSNFANEFSSAVGSNRNTGKVPQAPKPLPSNVLRIYTLGSSDILSIDEGDYPLPVPMIIGNVLDVSDDEGFTWTGSSTYPPLLRKANPLHVIPVLELNDADDMVLAHLVLQGGQYGLRSGNNSTGLSLEDVTALQAALDGIRIEAGSTIIEMNGTRAIANSRDGFSSEGSIVSIHDHESTYNLRHGMLLVNPGNVSIESSVIAFNGANGVDIANTSTQTAILGNTDLSLAEGNQIFSNAGHGVRSSQNVLVAGNTIYAHPTFNTAGIRLESGATAQDNVVFGNRMGIAITGAVGNVQRNRVYQNQTTGILADSTANLLSNVVYSNPIGMQLQNHFVGTLENNLIYASSDVAISHSGNVVGAKLIKNNTIYQPTGDGIRISNGSQNVRLRNNIVWVASGTGVAVTSNSQTGFASDFNLLYATGTGKVGSWQEIGRADLAAWQSAGFTDTQSISIDPLFVDLDGADNRLGYFSPTSDGSDDDFHLQSQFGSVHGGALAPSVQSVGSSYSLPMFLASQFVVDSLTSAAIDRGSNTDAFSNEPSPNGSFIDLGTYGNTPHASRSPAEYISVLRPNGGQSWPAGQTMPIRWRSHNSLDTVNIDLIRSGGSEVISIAVNTPNDGEFDWPIPTNFIPNAGYSIRITRNSGSHPVGVSVGTFSIVGPVNIYYVNDATLTVGDWTTAAGSDLNDGLTPSSPKASIQSILNQYTLGTGSIIRVDNGTYNLSTNVTISDQDAGVTLEGFYDPAQPTKFAWLHRGNVTAGSYAIQLNNADNVVLSRLQISGGYYGIAALNNSDSDGVLIRDSVVFNNQIAGIYFEPTNDSASILGNTLYGTRGGTITTDDQARGIVMQGTNAQIRLNSVFDHTQTGIDAIGSGTWIAQNIVYNNLVGILGSLSGPGQTLITMDSNRVFNNQNYGIDASGDKVRVTNNEIYENTGGEGNQSVGFGIRVGASEIRGNTIRGNIVGISASSGTISQNNIFGNLGAGISSGGNANIVSNTIYSNAVGIALTGPSSGAASLTGNSIYDNATAGISMSSSGGSNAAIQNNSVLQSAGSAIVLSNVSNIRLSGNILQSDGGFAIQVATDSQVGFSSNYNLLYATGSGKLVRWGTQEFNDLPSLVYGVGIDRNSRVADPRWIDRDGLDNILGFSTVPKAPAVYQDDNAATRIGTWTTVSGATAFGGNYLTNVIGVGNDSLTWTFNGLTPGETYHIAVSLPTASGTPLYQTFQVFDDDKIAANLQVALQNSVGRFTEGSITYRTIGYFVPNSTTLKVRLNDKVFGNSNTTIVGDAVRLQAVFGDGGRDNDFHLEAGSPAVDSANPLSYYLAEPLPNGGRTDIGAFGNTQEAALSQPQTLQVLSPNGLEKLEQGQIVPIQIRSSGLTQAETVALINSGGSQSNRWLADRYRLNGSAFTFGNNVNTSLVTNPAPAAVYQSYAAAGTGVGTSLSYQLPLPNGSYSVKLHFAEPNATAANQRKFDIKMQGTTVQAGFDIFAAAGGNLRAIALTHSVTLADGGGLKIDLVNTASSVAILSGIEIFAINPLGSPSPTVNLDISSDGGENWSSLAAELPLDAYGLATFLWNIAPNQPVTNRYLLRATSNTSTPIIDASDLAFQVASSGQAYYVNDGSTAGDEFSQTVGSDSNNGKSSDQPMRSLSALLAAYDLDPGDIVYVDAGNYDLLTNVVITSQDSGVIIQGPATGTALFNRGSTGSGSYGFELRNADGITLDGIAITGAEYGVYASDTSDSDQLTIRNSEVFNNYVSGIYLGSSNELSVIDNNDVYGTPGGASTDNQHFGNIYITGPGSLVTQNRSRGSSGRGIYIQGSPLQSSTIRDNTIYENSLGIESGYASVLNNTLTGNINLGISSSGGLTADNLVVGQAVSNSIGLNGSSEFTRNTVRNYARGIETSSNLIHENVFENNTTGVYFRAITQLEGNTIRNNTTGIQIRLESDRSDISNNLLEGNTLRGVFLDYASYPVTFSNNTIHQTTGTAFELNGGRDWLQLSNNIIWASGDYIFNDISDNKTGFTSDYNLFYTRGATKIARWQGLEIADLAQWTWISGFDRSSQFADPQFLDPANGNFQVATTSPSIDSGNPNSAYTAEPQPNGGRVNLGHLGNTSLAASSSSQSVQLVSPNGREKIQAGRSTQVSYRVAGLSTLDPIALVNTGGNAVQNWTGDEYRTSGIASGDIVAGTINTTAVVSPPPSTIYTRFATTSSSAVGSKLSYALPVSDGNYSIRLHFVEHQAAQANVRKFDIRLQGVTVQSSFDIFAAAGASMKATARTFDVLATGGSGITLDLVNVLSSSILSGIEVFRYIPNGIPAPTVNLEVSANAGNTWSTLGTNLPVDRFGRGNFTWNVPNDIPLGDQYLLRVSSVQNPSLRDDSDRLFQLAAAGTDFYVNDSSSASDTLTTTVGLDTNDGKSPATPMLTLAALLDAYDLEPGDVVHVDHGTHILRRNIVLSSNDNGVRIEGPAIGEAILTRDYVQNTGGQTNDTSFVFELTNADNFTLDRLTMTGAYFGISAASGSDSDGLKVSRSKIVGNTLGGIRLEASNDGFQLLESQVLGLPGGTSSDNQPRGVFLNSSSNFIEDNVIRNSLEYGISLSSSSLSNTIRGNDIFGNDIGINLDGGSANSPNTVTENFIHDNVSRGIKSQSRSILIGNTVFGHSGPGDIGIEADGMVIVSNNIVFSNTTGIRGSAATVSGNRVFNHSAVGVLSSSSTGTIDANQVYSNSIGFQLEAGFAGDFTNNTIYANTNSGVVVRSNSTNGIRNLFNNSISHSVGDAIRLENAARNVKLLNNIVVVDGGTSIAVNADSQVGFASNYNLLQATSVGGNIGRWGGVSQASLSAWQTTSSQDPQSLTGNPGWGDIDGADNIFGYAQIEGVFRDGGPDDNFTLLKLSPAVDRGLPLAITSIDATGGVRVDDPGTAALGLLPYRSQVLPSSQFSATGIAQSWRSDNTSFAYTLPFAFPFYDGSYNSLFVSTEGFLQFVNNVNAGSGANSTVELAKATRIAPFWDNLVTNAAGNDIFIDTSLAGQVKFRWHANQASSAQTLQFAVVLFANGDIRFDYGPSNLVSSSQTTGVSMGTTTIYSLVAGYDGNTAGLNNAPSVLLTRDAAATDLGSFEFRGSSLDVTPPRIEGTIPGEIDLSATTVEALDRIWIAASEVLNPFDARSAALYELRSDGGNGLFGDLGDTLYPLTPIYVSGTQQIELRLNAGQTLPAGRYRLTITSNINSSLHDLVGLGLDGDGDGTAGGNYERIFRVVLNSSPVLIGAHSMPSIPEDLPASANAGTLVASLVDGHISDSDGPGEGIAVTGMDEVFGTWQYTTDGTSWNAIAPQVTDGQILLLASDSNTRIRFLPALDYFGHAGGIRFRAWDRSDEHPEGTSVQSSTLRTNPLSLALGTSTIEVTPINDAPSFNILQNSLTVDEDSGPLELANWLADISAGPYETDHLNFLIDSISNPSLFSVAPTISAAGVLAFTSAPHAIGSTDVTIHLHDGSLDSISKTFRLNIRNLNDAPTGISLSHHQVTENLPAGTLVGFLSTEDVDTDDSHDYLLVSGDGSQDNDAFVLVGNELRLARALDFELSPQWSIRIRSTDRDGLSVEQVLEINLANLPEIDSISIGDGTVQRSMVRSLSVVFDMVVDIDELNTGAFIVRRRGPTGGLVTIDAFASNNSIPGKTVVTLSFSGSFVDASGSLADGNYDLTIDGSKIRTASGVLLDGDGDGHEGGNREFGEHPIDRFFRHFGDTNGDRSIGVAEFNEFRNTFGKTAGQAGYNSNFDFDANGSVSASDFNQFRSRFGRNLPFE